MKITLENGFTFNYENKVISYNGEDKIITGQKLYSDYKWMIYNNPCLEWDAFNAITATLFCTGTGWEITDEALEHITDATILNSSDKQVAEMKFNQETYDTPYGVLTIPKGTGLQKVGKTLRKALTGEPLTRNGDF